MLFFVDVRHYCYLFVDEFQNSRLGVDLRKAVEVVCAVLDEGVKAELEFRGLELPGLY